MSKSKGKSRNSAALIALGGGLAVILLLAASGFAFAANKESKDSFCASCHTQPESTYVQRSVETPPVDLASAHTSKGTRCIDCHSGSGVFGRMGAEMMGARNAIAWYTHTATQPSHQTMPVSDENCLKCHQEVTARRDMNNHFHAFLSRWQAVDPKAATCVSCHGGHTTGGVADQRYMNVPNVQAECEACHNAIGEGGG
jgi:nitrate/TMAO reductase-like tetraheme cytochrome c subunit